jgi:1-acyl-sn-glycerol-3-phosphate acyltransferase
MKISRTKTLLIVIRAVLHTVYTCLCSIFRRFFAPVNRAWVDLAIQRWVDALLKYADIRCVVVNPFHVEPVPGKATIIMCNHSSLLDIPISFKAFPHHSMRMLAKKELSKIPILGQGMTAAEFIFIDRKNRQRAEVDLEATKRLLESGIVMWVAPEGTRSRDGQLARFKKGVFVMAIQANATIIPIGIRDADKILPARTFQLHTNQTAEIHIGKPIEAANYSLEQKDALIDAVWTSIHDLITQTPSEATLPSHTSEQTETHHRPKKQSPEPMLKK